MGAEVSGKRCQTSSCRALHLRVSDSIGVPVMLVGIPARKGTELDHASASLKLIVTVPATHASVTQLSHTSPTPSASTLASNGNSEVREVRT